MGAWAVEESAAGDRRRIELERVREVGVKMVERIVPTNSFADWALRSWGWALVV